eukprot:TRINITY_DN28879_c0_g1_i1.p1 TRINITY_DN28879_c0_g1~~TRINITY_DN28879_c0_g1_i1.p1  ORF type:complete len:705 (+),score=99.26 TRINITY_DN28879_c0_g1_i1:49-2115(+)
MVWMPYLLHHAALLACSLGAALATADQAGESSVIDLGRGASLQVLREGDGQTYPNMADNFQMHYAVTLPDGSVFDSYKQAGAPDVGVTPLANFLRGVGKMTLGERAVIHLPGAEGAAELDFDVEVLAVGNKTAPSSRVESHHGHHGRVLSTGEVVAIVLGVPVFPSFICVWLCIRRRRKEKIEFTVLEDTEQPAKPMEGFSQARALAEADPVAGIARLRTALQPRTLQEFESLTANSKCMPVSEIMSPQSSADACDLKQRQPWAQRTESRSFTVEESDAMRNAEDLEAVSPTSAEARSPASPLSPQSAPKQQEEPAASPPESCSLPPKLHAEQDVRKAFDPEKRPPPPSHPPRTEKAQPAESPPPLRAVPAPLSFLHSGGDLETSSRPGSVSKTSREPSSDGVEATVPTPTLVGNSQNSSSTSRVKVKVKAKSTADVSGQQAMPPPVKKIVAKSTERSEGSLPRPLSVVKVEARSTPPSASVSPRELVKLKVKPPQGEPRPEPQAMLPAPPPEAASSASKAVVVVPKARVAAKAQAVVLPRAAVARNEGGREAQAAEVSQQSHTEVGAAQPKASFQPITRVSAGAARPKGKTHAMVLSSAALQSIQRSVESTPRADSLSDATAMPCPPETPITPARPSSSPKELSRSPLARSPSIQGSPDGSPASSPKVVSRQQSFHVSEHDSPVSLS